MSIFLNSTRIAQDCHFQGEKVAHIFFNALTHCNFHTEVKILERVWDSIEFAACSNEDVSIDDLIDQVKIGLSDLARGR